MLGPFFSRHVCVIFRTWTGTGHPKNTTCEIHVCRLEFGNFTTCFTIFFTVCFCESRLRQVQGTKKYRARYVEHQKMNYVHVFGGSQARPGPDQGQTVFLFSTSPQNRVDTVERQRWTRFKTFFSSPTPPSFFFFRGGGLGCRELSSADQDQPATLCLHLSPVLLFLCHSSFPCLLLVARKVVSRPGCQP